VNGVKESAGLGDSILVGARNIHGVKKLAEFFFPNLHSHYTHGADEVNAGRRRSMCIRSPVRDSYRVDALCITMPRFGDKPRRRATRLSEDKIK
jgi:hypothetical protein